MRDFKVGDEVVSLKNVSGCRVVGDKFIVQRGSMELDGRIWYIDNGGDMVHGDATEFSLVGETESDPINHPDHYHSESSITGGRVNYYLARIDHPQREDQPAYTAECEDIISALEMTFDEANIFKEIWRSANARLGNGKPDHKALYGAEKINHYAGRNLRRHQREAQK